MKVGSSLNIRFNNNSFTIDNVTGGEQVRAVRAVEILPVDAGHTEIIVSTTANTAMIVEAIDVILACIAEDVLGSGGGNKSIKESFGLRRLGLLKRDLGDLLGQRD